jgi:hypothetical protein
MKIREDNKLEFFFQNCPLWIYIKEISTFTFGAWSFLMVQIRFTPNLARAHKLGKLIFQETQPWKLDHEVGPRKKAIFHGPTSWCMV